ncbi:uncharacterized protein LOC108915461 [Anoplophora glabripennis]|uniref:uncharacterized protein LOC108915461 n=1 Tax=Anoplophora glabripennis TaxID=217634 RepID=UPI0008743D47|nr:uncharacterized protein LOC108915461 [Anoplophora glabripennis]
MIFRTVVIIAFLCVTVHFSECRRHHHDHWDDVADSLKELKKSIKKKTITTQRPPPPNSAPRWTGKLPNLPQDNRYYNPAAYGPPPLNYYPFSDGRDFSNPKYTINDTGDTTLGFYLKQSLVKITPTYHYYNTKYDPHGYIPKYDHYSIHHYYHNNKSIQTEVTIPPDIFVICAGNSSTLCPTNTTALCTSNGALLCVTRDSSTVPCLHDRRVSCVRSSVPCKENHGPECETSLNGVASISIPCVSTVNVYGTVSYLYYSILITNNSTSDNSRKSFCVTVLALPAERRLSEGEKVLKKAENVLAAFAVSALGINGH